MPENLFTHPIHLGLGAKALAQPAFTGMPLYEAYSARHASDGAEGRLVALYTFSESWDSWEMHPKGDEVVLCTAGTMTLHQQHADGTTATVQIGPGEYVINPPVVGTLLMSMARLPLCYHRRVGNQAPPAMIVGRAA